MCKIRLIISCLFVLFVCNVWGQQKVVSKSLEPEQSFDFKTFVSPSKKYAPYTRWWWPGNDVSKDELEREIQMFAANGFGGVEIQPLNIGIPMPREKISEILGWDTPDYYSNLITVFNAAKREGLKVDLTNGSGWPPGGSYLDVEDGFLSLNHADTVISGGQLVFAKLPKAESSVKGFSKLQAVVASKVLLSKMKEGTETVLLDSSSVQVLTEKVKTDTLRWNAPEGKWKIIAFWAVLSGERTMTVAMPKQGPVVNHLDSTKVLKNYSHLLGTRTGLKPYFGDPLRAVFTDSYEFKADRHYSFDFIDWFKNHRGYDITPWLPANMQKGYNMVEFMNPHADPDFMFSDEDWRLRYDYDLTISELLEEHFLETSKNYLERKGLLYRTQPYGLNMDMMAMAGMASIPETESMNGSEGRLKLTTSGANLYNRPLISAESVVYGNRAYATTPQMIRLSIDKLFAAGVNQIVYHGVPYRYQNDRLPKEGWYPFSTPFIPSINFSSNLGESNPYWKFQKKINEYVSRTQHAMQVGNPISDVLIYYPFLNFTGLTDNPNEIFTRGTIDKSNITDEQFMDPQAIAVHEWCVKVWPIINELEKNGITWNWVNDKSLQLAEVTDNNKLNIRGNIYKGLIIANAPYIQIQTAERINNLASIGLNLLFIGNIPDKQPSFRNWVENDKKTNDYLTSSLEGAFSKYEKNNIVSSDWISFIQANCPIQFDNPYPFIRQSQRELADGSRLHFIWNTSDEWQEISLSINDNFSHCYWLDAEDGTIQKNKSSESASIILPPYCTRILFASTEILSVANDLDKVCLSPVRAKKILSLTKWNIRTDNKSIDDTTLFDWKTKEKWKYESSIGQYHSKFKLKRFDKKSKYLIDFGEVKYTAELYVNGQLIGTRINLPYVFDVSNYLKKGENEVLVKVLPTLLNGFIGNANSGDKKYRQFMGKENNLMSEGLIGPVSVYKKHF
ncbi:glycosyl hydrolase [Draconibacterium halophilum]|uniref:Beta-mannosidase-like galactose-binding domain-containing protein n=1 Tax=Draconibacterium halophilum TaxID=2706887 RepID=A0A6C0RH36_9BACT|nr:glycosyl hydrolase [Draconibacterium halophilum]QIA09142.1 hypothetical protein G0Q07_16085 [Draconibacterium halophilum]